MFHSEGNKGGSFSVGVLQTYAYVDQKSDPKRLVWVIMRVMISRLWLEIVSEHIIGDSERDVDWGQ